MDDELETLKKQLYDMVDELVAGLPDIPAKGRGVERRTRWFNAGCDNALFRWNKRRRAAEGLAS